MVYPFISFYVAGEMELEMNRIPLILISLILIFNLASCGKKNEESKTFNSSSSVSQTISQSISVSSSIAISSEQSKSNSNSSKSLSKKSSSASKSAASETIKTEAADDILLFLVNKQNEIPSDYKLTTKTVGSPYASSQQVNEIEYDNLISMFKTAKANGYNLWLWSGYRSVDKQTALFNKYVKEYTDKGYTQEAAEKAVNAFSARPRQSEHSTGFANDITSKTFSGLNQDFENTREFKWLNDNAAKFGFILRYPKDKVNITGYTYEPWHYRYVGKKHAQKIKELGMCLEEYINWLKKN